jgi:DNA-binding response OmpR family regulator
MNRNQSGGPAILIIDDDDTLARDLRRQLASAGYFIRRATSGEEALNSLDAANTNLILLSLMLPDTDGLILCARLRARTTAPIVVLSERPREVDRALALELGAVDVVSGPVDLGALLALLPVDRQVKERCASAAGM